MTRWLIVESPERSADGAVDPARKVAGTSFGGDNRGNVAGVQNVDRIEFKTFIRHEGGFAPIQTATLKSLDQVRVNLARLIAKHEVFALMPLAIPFGIALIAGVGIDLFVTLYTGAPVPKGERGILLFLALLLGLPAWFGLHDVRRRHRRVVEQAEHRWAAIVVEIGERGEGNLHESPWQAFRRWRNETKAPRREQRARPPKGPNDDGV